MADLVIAPGDHLHYSDSFILNELVIADCYHEHVPDTLGFYFFTDFSEYTTGLALTDWTERWDTSNVSNTVQAATWEHSLGKKVLYDNNSAARKFLSWDDFDGYDNENVDILILFNITSTMASNPVRVGARCSGASSSENGYFVQATGTNISLFRYVAGATTNIKQQEIKLYADSYYWIRFRVNDSSLKVKVWGYQTPQPYAWNIDETDTNITGNGWCGFGAYDIIDADIYYYAATLGGTASPEIPEAFTGIENFGALVPFYPANNSNVNYARAHGGTFVSNEPMYVTGMSVWCNSTHTSQIRLAVYTGGDLSTGPEGAELLVDLGQTSGSDTDQWVEVTCTPVLIPQGKPLWLVFKGNDSGFNFVSNDHPGSSGSFQNAKGRYAPTGVISTDETTSFPDPWPTDAGTFADLWYCMRISIQVSTKVLVIAGDYLEHYADNVALNTLEVADCYHLHVVDPDPLVLTTGAFELVIAGDYLDLVTDPVSLTQIHELAVALDNFHLHVVDPDPITILVILPTQEAYHDHVVDPDPLPLTQVHILAGLDAYHDVIDDPFYFILPLLVALDNFHLNIVDPDPLPLGVHLAVSNCFHSHMADDATLTEFFTLWGLDAFHDIYNDDPILEFDAVNVSWGDQRNGGGGLLFQSHTNYCGNTVLWPGCKVQINRFYINIGSTHDIQRRLAVYQGGDDPDNKEGASESDLIADFGLTSGSDTDQWIYVDAPSDTYLNNSHELVWLVTKADDESSNIIVKCGDEDEGVGYDFAIIGGGSYGTALKVTDDTGTPALDAEETVAFPSTFPELPDLNDDPGVHSAGAYSICMYLTFTVTSNVNLIVKPGVSEIVDDPLGYFVETEYMGVQDAFHLHEADPLALTQVHELAVNEAHHLFVDDPFYFVFDLLVALDNDHLHFADQADVVPIVPILAADCYHENIPDPIDLIQLHILTVAECYHAHDGPNIALTQEHNLAITDNHLLHFAQSSNLVEGLLLQIPESYHDVVSDPCEPVQVVNLLVAQGWFDHYADTFGLIPLLDIAETYHEHYSDALILSLHLVVAESNHEIATDPLTLTQDHSLVVLGAFHEHFADLADLTEVGTLVVNPCFHLHDGESIPFGVHLTIQEAYHEHFIDHISLVMALILADAYHLLDSDLLVIEQLHYLEIAGTGTNTSDNYHIVTSDNIAWGYLLPDLGHLSLVNATTDRTLNPCTPVLSLKWIEDQRDIEDVTTYRTMRKAA
ncbi:MAG TPA: hypothetical protein DDW42_10385 [Desulfobacteraceae bacterium]|nr:hypothetical protein [Desulfobacteraceae bacterium]